MLFLYLPGAFVGALLPLHSAKGFVYKKRVTARRSICLTAVTFRPGFRHRTWSAPEFSTETNSASRRRRKDRVACAIAVEAVFFRSSSRRAKLPATTRRWRGK